MTKTVASQLANLQTTTLSTKINFDSLVKILLELGIIFEISLTVEYVIFEVLFTIFSNFEKNTSWYPI